MDAYGKLIISETISTAWIEVLNHLLSCNGHCYNLIVQIKNPIQRNIEFEKDLDMLCRQYELLTIKHVAYTIFPKTLWQIYKGNHNRFFKKYVNRVYPYLQNIKRGWGTYFHRMLHWTAEHDNPSKNQLLGIIDAINQRPFIYKAAYTIQIGSPRMNFCRVMGAPCLTNMALQLQENRVMNLMAMFRNHYLFPRIYGNYVGLGQLLEFLCERTGFNVGILTSVSSHVELSSPGNPPMKSIRQFLEIHG
jgi:hypothetical protein